MDLEYSLIAEKIFQRGEFNTGEGDGHGEALYPRIRALLCVVAIWRPTRTYSFRCSVPGLLYSICAWISCLGRSPAL